MKLSVILHIPRAQPAKEMFVKKNVDAEKLSNVILTSFIYGSFFAPPCPRPSHSPLSCIITKRTLSLGTTNEAKLG